MKSSKEPVTITIEKSQNAKAFNRGECFFRDELDQIKKWIEDIVNNKTSGTIKPADDNAYSYEQNTIAVLGPRGVGKTSVLLSLENIIKSEEKELDEKIIWLPPIDSTRMEENDTFLIVIVANILKQIKPSYKGDLSQNIRDSLELLSRDFVILAPNKVHVDQWKDLLGDPNSFAYELLSHAHSGLTLAKSFNDFLEVCLKEMKAKIFIQPIDEVDNTMSQGWPVLETLRRYMASPCLINILSGDIRLYQSLIRKQQADKFKSLIKIRRQAIEDNSKILLQTSELVDQIFQITDQYLAKVMPANLRIYLTPLSVKVIAAAERDEEFLNLQYDISGADLEKKVPFSTVYANFSSDLLNIPKPKPLELYDSLKRRSWLPFPLLPLTTRNMIRFLNVIKYWVPGDNKNNKDNSTKKEREANEANEAKAKNMAIESLVHIFNSSLYNSNIQTGNLLSIKFYKDITWLAKYCLDIELKLPSFWTLETRYEDEEINHRALLLQIFLLQAWKERDTNGLLLYPDGPWSYVIKVCFPCWMIDTFHPKKDDLNSFKEFVNIGIVKRHTYLAGECISSALKFTFKIEDEVAREKRMLSQTMPVHYIGIAKLSQPDVKFKERNELTEKSTEESKLKITDAYFILRWFMLETSSGSWLSILIGLARLTDVLREGPLDEDRTEDEDRTDRLRNFVSLLTEKGMLQIFDIGRADWVPSYDSNDTKYELSKNSKLMIYLYNWLKQIKEKDINVISDEGMVSPLVISRTFLRFSKNLDYIRRRAIYNDNFVESKFERIMEIWVSALLNSLLIEELIFKKGISDINIKLDHITEGNTTPDNNNLFINNLDKVMQMEENNEQGLIIPYTYIVLCCPFFLVFLKKAFDSSNFFKKITKLPIYKKIAGINDGEASKSDDFEAFINNVREIIINLQVIATKE